MMIMSFCYHPGLSSAIVTIECSSQWIGVPDVHIQHIAVPVTAIDPGGGHTGVKLPSRLIDVSTGHILNVTH